jgi:hypothetical protein
LSSCRYADTGVLSLAPLKLLVLSTRVVPSEPHSQTPHAEPLPPQAEEEPVVVVAVEEPSAPPPLVAVVVVEEGWTTVETTASQAALAPPVGAGSGSAAMVVVSSDEDTTPPLLAGDHDVAMLSAPEPSPAAEVPKPSPTAGAVETSSVAGTVIVEEVMELATCRFIDFPSIGIIDLDAPELPSNDREMLKVATERMFVEPSILEKIALVPRVLHQYEHAGGFAPSAVPEAVEAVPEEPAAGTESVAVVSAPPPTSEGQEASLPQPAEATEPTAVAATVGATEDDVGEAGSPSPCPIVASADEAVASDEPAAALQERVAPEDTTRATSSEIQGPGGAQVQLCCRE